MKNRRNNFPVLFLNIAVVTAIYFTAKAAMKDTFEVDHVLGRFFAKFPDSANPFFIKITALGTGLGIGIVGLVTLLWLLLKKRDYAGAGVLALAVALGDVVSSLFKNGIARPRPSLEHLVHVNSYSYPSGHAMVGSILYILIAYFLIKEVKSRSSKMIIGVACGLLLLLIGASRIILQVHYPSDVIGGFALGYVWVNIWIFIYRLFTIRFGK